MKAFFQITQPTGHVYEIPVAVVAENRAKTMLGLHPDEFTTIESAMEDTTALFNEDAREIKDWASNNMNWPDLERHAKLIRFTPPENQWFEGEWSYHDHKAIMGELNGDAVMKSPVEFVATTMIESAQLCNVTILNSETGKPFGGVAVFIGSPQVVDSYIATLTHTTNHLTGGATDTAPAH